MRRVVCLLGLLGALAGPAAAEPARAVSVRVAGAVGAMKEITWLAPEVDVVATFAVGVRGFVEAAAGYASLDNHTFLADGRTIRLAAAGGATVFGSLRAAAALDLELVAYHADPDVLTNHPGVDILSRRGGLMPSASVELSYPVGASTAIGLFGRLGLRALELFDTTAGDRGTARLVLAGAFVQVQLR